MKIRYLIFLAQINALREYHTLIKEDVGGRDKYIINRAMSSLNAMFTHFDKNGTYENTVHDRMVGTFISTAEQIENDITKQLNNKNGI